MAFQPGHHQVVEIANGVRPIASNLRNVVDACDATARWYTQQSDEVKAEAVKIRTVERFQEIRAIVEALRDEMDAALLDYEGPKGLPPKEAE